MISCVARYVVECEEEPREVVTKYEKHVGHKVSLEIQREIEQTVLEDRVVRARSSALSRHLHLLHTSFQHKVTVVVRGWECGCSCLW